MPTKVIFCTFAENLTEAPRYVEPIKIPTLTFMCGLNTLKGFSPSLIVISWRWYQAIPSLQLGSGSWFLIVDFVVCAKPTLIVQSHEEDANCQWSCWSLTPQTWADRPTKTLILRWANIGIWVLWTITTIDGPYFRTQDWLLKQSKGINIMSGECRDLVEKRCHVNISSFFWDVSTPWVQKYALDQ